MGTSLEIAVRFLHVIQLPRKLFLQLVYYKVGSYKGRIASIASCNRPLSGQIAGAYWQIAQGNVALAGQLQIVRPLLIILISTTYLSKLLLTTT